LALRVAACRVVRNGFDETLEKVQHGKVGLEREDRLVAVWTPFVFGGVVAFSRKLFSRTPLTNGMTTK